MAMSSFWEHNACPPFLYKIRNGHPNFDPEKMKVLLSNIRNMYQGMLIVILVFSNNLDIIFPNYANYIDTESQLWHAENVFKGTHNGMKRINW